MAVSQHIFTLGINHQSAPVAIRERMAFPPETLTPALRELVTLPGVSEGAILSTCNRTEIYCHASTPESVSRWLTHYHSLESHHVEPYLYQHADGTAVKHAFRVASGLDSMVIGEPQILGQVKEAARARARIGHASDYCSTNYFRRRFPSPKKSAARRKSARILCPWLRLP